MLIRLAVIGIVLILALAGLWLGRSAWLPSLGRFLVHADPLKPAQAIAPLAGDTERVIYAAQLYAQGYAGWFLIADMPLTVPGVRQSYAQLARQEAIWRGIPQDRILLAGEEVTNTYAELQSLHKLAHSHGFDSLLLVTSAYHTRRASIMIHALFPAQEFDARLVSVADGRYNPANWWKTEDGARETWTEYLKLALYLAGYR